MTRLKNRIPSSLPLLSLVGIIRVWSLLLQLCFERTLILCFTSIRESAGWTPRKRKRFKGLYQWVVQNCAWQFLPQPDR
jgi:hypothetical protein